jgi:PST family polysaccharide transporter
MIDRLKNLLISNKSIVANFSYLSAFQLFNILLPLVTYPYLIRVLGTETYGVVIFSQAIIMYFSMLINFGFNISATKDVAEYRKNAKKLNEIVSSVFIIKAFLWIFSFIILVGLILFIPSLQKHWLLFIFSFGITFNELLFPQWFFQGIEKMKYITIINIISKILFTFLIFFYVKNEQDYLLVPLFQSMGAFIGGVIAIYVVLVKEKISIGLQKITIVKYHFLESLPLFISAVSVQIYVNANKILVGAFLGMTEVAYYDLGEKVLRLIKTPVGMLGQAAFPSLAIQKSVKKINNVMKVGIFITSVLLLLVFIFSDLIVTILGGSDMQNAVPIMRILSVSGLMVAFSQFLGTSRLIIFGYKKEFTQVILSSGIVFCIVGFFLYVSDNVTVITLSWLAVAVETWVTFSFFLVNYRKKLLV